MKGDKNYVWNLPKKCLKIENFKKLFFHTKNKTWYEEKECRKDFDK